MDVAQPTAVFFQKKYAWNNNWGKVVGFTPDSLLILERGDQPNYWITQTLPATDVLGVRVSQARSIYLLILGLLAGALGGFVMYVGVTGQGYRPGIFTIPIVTAAFAWFCFRGSMRLRVAFDLGHRQLTYKSWPGSYDETLAAIPRLRDWAKLRKLPIVVDLPSSAS